MMQARMRQAYLLAVVVVASVVVFGGTAFAQSSNSQVGTWKLNVAKSKYNPGPAPKSVTVKYEAAGAGVKVTVDSVGATGTVNHYTYTANYDGKDSPEVGNPSADTIALTRVNATTTTSVSKKGGKVTGNSTRVVSSDGKTLTNTSKGTNAAGQPTDNVQVYDKQ
jgi:hypothetical protein